MTEVLPLQTVCIGIPTYKRPDALAGLLAKFAPLLKGRPHIRVSVVNDGSHDPAYDRVLKAQGRPWLSYRALPDNLGCGGARRAAFDGATEDWFVSIDDDCVPDARWLDTMEALINTAAADFLAGEVRPAWEGPPTPYQEDLALIDQLSSLVVTPFGLMTAVTANLAVRRGAYERAGGFAEDMRGAEDCDLTQRLIASGATYRLCPHLVIDHVAQRRYLPTRRRFRSYGHHAARYVLIRQNWRIAARQPMHDWGFLAVRLRKQFGSIFRDSRKEGYSRWRSFRRAWFRGAMAVHYELEIGRAHV